MGQNLTFGMLHHYNKNVDINIYPDAKTKMLSDLYLKELSLNHPLNTINFVT